MKTIIFTLATSLLFLQSCADRSAGGDNQLQDSVVADKGHSHDTESQAIELNNGEKWVVDSNMMIHLRQMETDVSSFTGTSQEDFQSLAEKLTTTIDTLTSNCTMTGKAHDELHKWLLPYIDLVDELYESESEAVSKAKYAEIKAAYVQFNEFFQ